MRNQRLRFPKRNQGTEPPLGTPSNWARAWGEPHLILYTSMGQFVGSLPFAILMFVVLGGGTVAANIWYRGGIENPFNGSREGIEMNTLSDRLVNDESGSSGGRKTRRKKVKSRRK